MASDDILLRFLNSLGIDNPGDYDMTLTFCGKNASNRKILEFVIRKETPWTFDQYSLFVDGLSRVQYLTHFCFTYTRKPTINEILDFFKSWHQSIFHVPYILEVKIKDEKICFVFESRDEFLKYEYRMQEFKECMLFLNYDVVIQHEIIEPIEDIVVEDPYVASNCAFNNGLDDFDGTDFEESQTEENEEEENVVEKEIVEKPKSSKKNDLPYQTKEGRESFPLPPQGGYYVEHQTIGQINGSKEFVSFIGKVFLIDEPRLVRNLLLFRFGIKDKLNEGLFVEVVADSKPYLKEKYLRNFRVGDNVRVYGRVARHFRTNEIQVDARCFELLDEDKKRDDDCVEKRVELHLHTKMSALDGVNDIKEYIALASHMGHKAIALTDHGSLQSFPKAQEHGKKFDMKVLYGSELYMIPDRPPFIQNPCDRKINDATYVVFDLETTGLSFRYNRIMEIGAVKVRNGVISEELTLLIDPEQAFGSIVQRLTGLTNEEVKGKPKFADVVDKVLDFFGNAILVTHNAPFDIGHMNAELERLGREPLKNPVIDTVSISRSIFSDRPRHNLGALAKNVGAIYSKSDAHRALYDATVLAKSWIQLIDILDKDNSEFTHADIDSLPVTPSVLKHLFPSHVTALAKNKKGIKSLFEITSLSLVDYVSVGIPKIPRSELQKRRENLLLGSACYNGDVFQAALEGTDEDLAKAIDFYDFIEVQPIGNYKNLIDSQRIVDEAQIKEIVVRIINMAKQKGKIIVATGDVHYLNPANKEARDVYIYTKGLEGRPHPLCIFGETMGERAPIILENPDQHYRSTQEMLDEFVFLNDDELVKEIVITNTNKISDMIGTLTPFPSKLFTPVIENSDVLLRDLCYATAHDMYGETLPKVIVDRLETELNGIIDNGYAVIYYIAHKIVEKANKDGEIVGSRGSVGSSFAATMAKITEVNPLAPHYRCPHCKHFEFSTDHSILSGFDLPEKKCPKCENTMESDGQNIPFETFLGFGANKVPDIDLNFSGNYHTTAHNYTRELLGAENVFRAGTISTVALDTASAKVRDYYKLKGLTNPSYARVQALAADCLNVKRTSGQHPGGVVVVPEGYDVNDFTPIQDPGKDDDSGWRTTHLDFNSLHDTLLKLDLLGHVDPYALRFMSELTNIDPRTINLSDPKILSLFYSRDVLVPHKQENSNFLKEKNGALGIPEFGTEFVRRLLNVALPKTVADLIAISGLSHGTGVWQGNAHDLIKKDGMTLHQVIGCRDDIMIYLIDKGLDPETAFKITEDVRKGKKVKKDFEKIMKAHDVPQYYIDSCNKIQYMFPKAHASAYVTMALRVGYYKIYQPLAYYATYFTLRTDKYDIDAMLGGYERITARYQELHDQFTKRTIEKKDEEIYSNLKIAIEMHERGYRFLPFDLMRSKAFEFVIDEERKGLIPPFQVLAGVGPAAAQSFVDQRGKKMYTSKKDLKERSGVNSSALQAFERLGILDGLRESDELNLFDFF